MNRLLAAVLCTVLLLWPLSGASAAEEYDDDLRPSSAEEIMEVFGVELRVPGEAENVSYQIYDTFGQMQLTLNGIEYTVRVEPTDSFANIAPFLRDPWDITDQCLIGWCEGRVHLDYSDDEILAVCLWYDAAPGLMYAVYTEVSDFIGLDVQGVAEAVFVPMQGESDVLSPHTLYKALSACTGYAGTAGSSLKNAIAACRLAAFAQHNQTADVKKSTLGEMIFFATGRMSDEAKEELALNMESIHSLLTAAFTDYDSVRGLFDDAGIVDDMQLLIDSDRAFEHYTALYQQITAWAYY